MNINGSIKLCESVSDKWELFDSERDMADIRDEYFALESNWYSGLDIVKIGYL